jgi:hypothetical protein
MVTEGTQFYKVCLLLYVRRKEMGLDTKAIYFACSKLACTKYENHGSAPGKTIKK